MAGGIGGKLLDAGDLRRLLGEIGEELAKRGRVAEIAVYGGAAMLLTFDNRPSTRDIDFVAVKGDGLGVTRIAEKVGERHGMPPGWFNDSVRMFVSDRPDHRLLGDFPVGGPPGLRVFLASPQYVLAMKLTAMRPALESHDLRDIWTLADECGISTADEAKAWMAKFFPGERLPDGGEERLMDLFDDKRAGKPYDPMRYW